MKEDRTKVAIYGPTGRAPEPVWSALYKRIPFTTLGHELTCWTVVFGVEGGPKISEETAYALARKVLNEDHRVICLCQVSPGTPWQRMNQNQQYWERIITRKKIESKIADLKRRSGFTIAETLAVIFVISILAAMLISLENAYRKSMARKYGTNVPPDKAESVVDPLQGHIFYKTNYLMISGLEEDPKTELPPGYAILSNSWGCFGFMDGDSAVHPFWADGGWKTEQEAIRAAWVSHIRRSKERIGVIKPPSYTIVRTNH